VSEFISHLPYSTPEFDTFRNRIESIENERWQRTNVTNLLKNDQSGTYYGRVKSNGRQKWRSLKTKSVSVVKLRLADFEKEIRAQGLVENGATIGDETSVARFIAMFRARSLNDSALDFHGVQDALVRHSPDRNPADAEHLRRLLLSSQKPFIHPNGDGSAALALSFEKKFCRAPFCHGQRGIRDENSLEERATGIVHGSDGVRRSV